MHTTFTPEITAAILARLRSANQAFAQQYPGDINKRRPIHVVYGGAHLFRFDTTRKLGNLALASLTEHAPDFAVFATALNLKGSDRLPRRRGDVAALAKKCDAGASSARRADSAARFAHTIYKRVVEKLLREPIEDYRIDFEDGYGYRTDAEEDAHAAAVAMELARGIEERTLPPFFGVRLKPFSEELSNRAARTLDIVLTTLTRATRQMVPEGFIVTLPKATIPQQVAALVELMKLLESKNGLPPGTLHLEIMIETPQALIDRRGNCTIHSLLDAADGRCVAVHLGPYDYTALLNITGAHQDFLHPACDFARNLLTVTLAQTGIGISDGPTLVMPIGPHRPRNHGGRLAARQRGENRAVVHRAWKIAFDNIQHSLRQGIYQGWDLHPAQVPVRYAATYAFFLEGLESATARMKNFVEKAMQATRLGEVFDDAATGQGLLNSFLRALHCGALTEEEARAAGLTVAELRTRSFQKILDTRRLHHEP